MNDERVKYYYALIEDSKLSKHGQVLHEEAWSWMSAKGSYQKREAIRFYSKEEYDNFLKGKQ